MPFQLPAAHKNRKVSLELLREASQLGVNLYEEHQRFVKSFDPRWRTDEQVLLLFHLWMHFKGNKLVIN